MSFLGLEKEGKDEEAQIIESLESAKGKLLMTINYFPKALLEFPVIGNLNPRMAKIVYRFNI